MAAREDCGITGTVTTTMNVVDFEQQIHSQHGEDGIIRELLRRVRGSILVPGVALEIGYRADENNTLALQELGWRVITVDARPDEADIQEWVIAGDVAERAKQWGVPRDLDFLSIDIDGQDLWVMDALLQGGYRPRVICIEYNADWGAQVNMTIPEQADWAWIPRTTYFGASLLALARCAASYGYVLVGCDSSGTNAFFAERCLETLDERVATLYRPPAYPPFPHGQGQVIEWMS